MSNLAPRVEQACEIERPHGAVELLIEPRERDIGGFSVRRVLPSAGCRKVGPWVFFDHMGPVRFPAGRGIDVRPHPHLNLATVTYLFEGELLHRDSLGNVQAIVPGEINLMVAGRGIVHSERERPEIRRAPHTQHGLQLWLGLPEENEQTAPAFYHYAAAEIPAVTVEGVAVRVMMGRAYGVASPVKTYAETLYAEARLEAGQRLALPAAAERAVYLASGSASAGGTRIPEHALAVVAAGAGEVVVEATAPSRLAVIGGETLGKRHIEWNFVSSRRERIEQAKADWRAGRFPKVPGDEEEFIPLPEDGA